MRNRFRLISVAAALAATIFLAGLAHAQPVPPLPDRAGMWCLNTVPSPQVWQPCTGTNPLAVTASVSASIAGFAPGGAYATVTSTAASADVALPAGAVVAAFNIGSTAVSCTLSVGAGVSVASHNVIQASSWFAFTVGSNTHISCINQAGDAASNVVVLSGGTGLPTGSGGGGGGSGGAVTIANGADVALGNNTDAANCASGTSLLACIRQMRSDVNAGVATPGSAPPTNVIAWGALGSGATGGLSRAVINCDQHTFKHITTATDTLIVQGVTGQTVFVCSSTAQAAGTATYFLENTASTNANCASANTQISGLTTMAANGQYGFFSPFWGGLKNTAGNGLCANSTGTGGFDLDVWWAQF